jgi:hypothetical protein
MSTWGTRFAREDSQTASVLLVRIVKMLSERLHRTNQMLSSVDLLADWPTSTPSQKL